jgi:thymidylate synthase
MIIREMSKKPAHVVHFGDHVIKSENWDYVYGEYLFDIMTHGEQFVGRNGETKAAFGCSARVDLRCGFPLTRLRKMPWKNLVREFLFDVGFNTNVEALGPAKHFWDFLADENGELGASAYCRQWRQWPPSAQGAEVPNETLETGRPVDQLRDVVHLLNNHPNSRQATVITHNPTAIDPACPPCHIAMQFAPSKDGWLDLMVPARSNDMVVGFPLDIARYALILKAVAMMTCKAARYVYMPSANSHIYENCYDLVDEMIEREPKPECQVRLTHAPLSFKELTLDSFELTGYDPHPAIKVAVN